MLRFFNFGNDAKNSWRKGFEVLLVLSFKLVDCETGFQLIFCFEKIDTWFSTKATCIRFLGNHV
jgi:hypothetical protein